jgi:hypothetical protein
LAKTRIKAPKIALPLLKSKIYEQFLHSTVKYCRVYIREKLAIAHELSTKEGLELPSTVANQICDLNKYSIVKISEQSIKRLIK